MYLFHYTFYYEDNFYIFIFACYYIYYKEK